MTFQMAVSFGMHMGLAVALLCTAACQPSGVQDHVHLQIGDPFFYWDVDVKGRTVRKQNLLANRTRSEARTKRVMSEAEATTFWNALGNAEVSKWLPVYEAKSPTKRTATTDWHLYGTSGGVAFQSEGGAAYPTDSDPRQTVEYDSGRRFEAVTEAFQAVVKPLAP